MSVPSSAYGLAVNQANDCVHWDSDANPHPWRHAVHRLAHRPVLLAAGHTVSIFTRGLSPDELPGEVERLCGDRDQGLRGIQSLHGRSWDACVDVSGYTPRQVRPNPPEPLAGGAVGRDAFVSAVAVYGDPKVLAGSRDACACRAGRRGCDDRRRRALRPPQVHTCEDIVQEIYGGRCAVLRPQIAVGPHDLSGALHVLAPASRAAGRDAVPGAWDGPRAVH